MRKLLIIIAATLLMSVQAATTTYIPTYSSFIQISQLGTDSVMAESKYHSKANDAKARIVEAYARQYGVTLNIPWWTEIKSTYFPPK